MTVKSKTPTEQERLMRETDFIVSKTDTSGIITYCNPIFIEFSGYSEDELLGAPHNILRHPDMPRSAFKLVWDTIASGKECFAYVKNMSKDGGFYWVFAHMTQDYTQDGKLTGYFSVRRYPKRSAIEKIELVYRQMLAAEQAAGKKNAIEAGTQVLWNLIKSTNQGYEDFIFGL